MKRFFLIFPVIVIVCAAVLLGQRSLFKALGVNGELTESGRDLGLVFEEGGGNLIQYRQGEDIVGQCVTLEKDFGLCRLCALLGLTITSKYEAEGIDIIEGVSPLVKFSISGRQANIQIALTPDKIVVGSPIIYGSY